MQDIIGSPHFKTETAEKYRSTPRVQYGFMQMKPRENIKLVEMITLSENS